MAGVFEKWRNKHWGVRSSMTLVVTRGIMNIIPVFMECPVEFLIYPSSGLSLNAF